MEVELICVKLVNVWRGGEEVTQESAKLPCKGSIPFRASYLMTNPECEKSELESRDETGFSEKQLDIAIETGVFKTKKIKKIKKTLFEKKSKK